MVSYECITGTVHGPVLQVDSTYIGPGAIQRNVRVQGIAYSHSIDWCTNVKLPAEHTHNKIMTNISTYTS
jgi:hypothetical protein